MKKVETINLETSMKNVFSIIQEIEAQLISQDQKVNLVREQAEKIITQGYCLLGIDVIDSQIVYCQFKFYSELLNKYVKAFDDYMGDFNTVNYEIALKLSKASSFNNEKPTVLEIDKNLPLSIYSDFCQSVPQIRKFEKRVSGVPMSFDYLVDYKSKYSANILVDPIFNSVSDLIYSFKEGQYSDVLPIIIATHLYRNYKDLLDKANVCLCVIPSSTKQRCELRFKELVNKVSYLLGIEDGFELITRSTDRLDSREQDKLKIDVLAGVNFSSKLKGKTVILLDDVSTIGVSIFKFNCKLRRLGVKQIQSIVLAKTYYVIGNNLPMPELIQANKRIYNLL